MRWSQWYIPTLKEAPGDAEVISHKLLIRAGMIRKLTSGIYTWLPLGLRTLNKAANIVREEMDRAGAQEILMPTVQPADLWRESGRWEHYGKELLRFKDRHERDYCLGPTHEEVVTDLIRGEVRSVAAPVVRKLAAVKGRDLAVVQKDAAARQGIHAAEDVQKRRLARAGRADDDADLAFSDRKARIVQGTDRALTGAVNFFHIFKTDECFSHSGASFRYIATLFIIV